MRRSEDVLHQNEGGETNLPLSFMEGQMDYVTFPWENCPVAGFIQPGASQIQMVSQMNLAGAFMFSFSSFTTSPPLKFRVVQTVVFVS